MKKLGRFLVVGLRLLHGHHHVVVLHNDVDVSPTRNLSPIKYVFRNCVKYLQKNYCPANQLAIHSYMVIPTAFSIPTVFLSSQAHHTITLLIAL
mgnify:CR=1 FL=1